MAKRKLGASDLSFEPIAFGGNVFGWTADEATSFSLIDRFVEGRVSRVSPEAPVPVLKFGAMRALLGGAGNVAANILAYGGSVTLIGLVGADEAAKELAALCALPRLTTRYVTDPTRPTTVTSSGPRPGRRPRSSSSNTSSPSGAGSC